MSLSDYLNEMKTIQQELDVMRNRSKNLKTRFVYLEKQVINILNEEKQLGVKYNDQAITINNKERKLFIPKKKQEETAIRILESC
jgi:hypothetical protein